MAYFRSWFLTLIYKSFEKKICSDNYKITFFAETSPKERDLIPNVMKPSPINGIKRAQIDKKRVIHSLIVNKKYNYKSSLREEPPYTMY